MTAPAHSPEPAKRSKRMYVLWGVALTLLVAAAIFCWLVVVPVWQVRNAVGTLSVATRQSSMSLYYSYQHDDVVARIRELGGKERALNKLLFYLRLPETITPHRNEAILLLGGCGARAKPVLHEYARGKPGGLNTQAARQALLQIEEAEKVGHNP